jgi:hypothetical protein
MTNENTIIKSKSEYMGENIASTATKNFLKFK